MTIYSSLTGLTFAQIEEKYQEIGYGVFKEELADIVCEEISSLQERFQKILGSKELDDLLTESAKKANYIADKKIRKVYHKVGLGRF